MRYRAIVAYDGSAYQGYQKQRDGVPTIQGELEKSLATILGSPITVWAAGRTDTGVHAQGQVIAFDANWRHDLQSLLKALNAHLPDDIALQVVGLAPDFHPRFDALSRVYRYKILIAEAPKPLFAKRAWQFQRELDFEAMQYAAAIILGEHDFATFGQPPVGTNTVREVFVSQWTQQQQECLWLTYTIEATAFLKHMVRRIVGMLVEVGLALRTVADFEAAFKSADLAQAGRLAPPYGLYLDAVRYADGFPNAESSRQTG
ncbi:MAG: tRNA pseudouridine(38-40) synthase TruA [Anaerolineae bacterium]|nr:tRNA pseudouridine(38-40) synthase TruA [Anaerolineae bacterium]